MRLLADENIDPKVVEWLRAEGHDVLAIAEYSRGAADVDMLADANEQRRTIVTRDKDFGDLVYRRALPVPGVVLLRYQSASRSEYLSTFSAQWPSIAPHVHGHFIVVTNKSIRSRPL